jgi:hypothetical protein
VAEQKKPGQKAARTLRCEEWEILLIDALDGLLPATESAAFEAHAEQCKACAKLLAQTKQGREWLGYLHETPEAPPYLLAKILSKTTGAEGVPLVVAAGPQIAASHAVAIPLRRSFYEARLLMTAAMAFFSIALTLNLAGVRLSNIRLADLRPSVLQGTLSRQFYGAKENVVRYYDNLRFVYQVESKVRELRRDVDEQPAAIPQPKTNTPNGGKSGHSQNPNSGHMPPAPQTVPTASIGGGVQLAALRIRKNPTVSSCLLPIRATVNRIQEMRERKKLNMMRVVLPLARPHDDRATNRSGGHASPAGKTERSLA